MLVRVPAPSCLPYARQVAFYLAQGILHVIWTTHFYCSPLNNVTWTSHSTLPAPICFSNWHLNFSDVPWWFTSPRNSTGQLCFPSVPPTQRGIRTGPVVIYKCDSAVPVSLNTQGCCCGILIAIFLCIIKIKLKNGIVSKIWINFMRTSWGGKYVQIW